MLLYFELTLKIVFDSSNKMVELKVSVSVFQTQNREKVVNK